MLRKLSIASGLRSATSGTSGPSSAGHPFIHGKEKKGKTVKYTSYSKHKRDDDEDDDLDEVAVISNTIPENVTYGSGSGATLGSTNGPRLVPGIITSTGFESKPYVPPPVPFAPKISATATSGATSSLTSGSSSDQNRKHSISGLSVPGPSTSKVAIVHHHHPQGQQHPKSEPKEKEIETVSSKVTSKEEQRSNKDDNQDEINAEDDEDEGHKLLPASHEVSSALSAVSAKKLPLGESIERISDKSSGKVTQRKKKKEKKEPTAGSGKKRGEKEVEKWETSTLTSGEKSGCNWSFVFDPSGRLIYYWSMIVSLAFIYNSWVILYRFAFEEINSETMALWLTLDGISDFIYVIDIAVHFRIGFLEEGVLQTDGAKLRQHYMNSTMFYIDCLCLLPLDFLYLSIGFNSMLRCFRLVKIYRFWAFLDRTERHTNYPNVFRTLALFHYILVLFHWNACLYHLISIRGGFGSSDWFEGSRVAECSDVDCDYLHAFYWSTLALTTIGDLPRPRTKSEYIFLIIELLLGLFLLATVLGHVANIVTNVSAARKEFQAKLDSVKTYMRMRRVPDHLKIKVIKWFDYLWMTQKSADEDKCVGFLPAKLKAEIAIHVHLDTLKRVEIFQNTEAGFLCALVLRLKPVLFSPSDYVCRKGEIGKEMYIVNRGKLQVVTDNGKTVLATLRAGSYFGEISILNMGNAGNRRTASVRSVGYSDLFCLNKHDMWEVLKDYPAARIRLEAIAVKRLEKYRKDPLKKSDENEILESVANRTLLSRSPRPPSTPQGPEDYDHDDLDGSQPSMSGSGNSDQDNIWRRPKVKGQSSSTNLKLPSFGLTPASPTNKHPPSKIGSHSARPSISDNSQPTQFLLSTTSPSHWYERRTSSPQTLGEVMMATISPVSMAIPNEQVATSNVQPQMFAFRGLSPTHSVPQIGIQGSQSSFGSDSHHGDLRGHLRSGSPSLLPRTPIPGEVSQEVLVAEIKRLHDKLHLLESENSAMTTKLSNVHSLFEERLKDIEEQMTHKLPQTVAPQITHSVTTATTSASITTPAATTITMPETPTRPSVLGHVLGHASSSSGSVSRVTTHKISTSPISEVTDASTSSSCGSEEMSSERNKESII